MCCANKMYYLRKSLVYREVAYFALSTRAYTREFYVGLSLLACLKKT